MTTANVALSFHLLGAFSLVAGAIVAGVAFETARRRETAAEIALLLGLSRIGPRRSGRLAINYPSALLLLAVLLLTVFKPGAPRS